MAIEREEFSDFRFTWNHVVRYLGVMFAFNKWRSKCAKRGRDERQYNGEIFNHVNLKSMLMASQCY